MVKCETRIMEYTRGQLSKFEEKFDEYKQTVDDNIARLDTQLNDYRSQVLWRIRDCEELLKSRVSNQELNDQLKAIEARMKSKGAQEKEIQSAALQKVLD